MAKLRIEQVNSNMSLDNSGNLIISGSVIISGSLDIAGNDTFGDILSPDEIDLGTF